MPIILYLLVFRLTQSLQPQLRLSSWLEVTQSAKSLFALVIWSVPRWCELLTSTTTIELFKLWLSSRTNRVSCRIICSVVINRKLRVEFNILNIDLQLIALDYLFIRFYKLSVRIYFIWFIHQDFSMKVTK